MWSSAAELHMPLPRDAEENISISSDDERSGCKLVVACFIFVIY